MPTTIETVMTPLGATGPITSNASPIMGKINRYNASAGNLAVSLPALSSLLNLGARVAVEKDVLDTSANTVTVNCAGSDTFDSGAMNEVLRVAGQLREFEVVQIGSTKYWKLISGNTPLSQLDGRYVAKGSLVMNVKDFGVKGDGSTDDTTAINACIAGAISGSTIYFPPGTYLISAPIVEMPGRKLTAGGHAHADTTIIKQKNGANITNTAGLTGLIVASAWFTNAAFCDNPARIENLTIDGNKANNSSSTACGIALTNFRTWVVDCDIINTPKDGIRFTDTTANGTNIVTNSCVENRIMNCRIDTTGGDGVRVLAGSNTNTDGYLANCIISNTTGSGVNLDRSAGWHITGNHLYSIKLNGIYANNAYGTFITNNYVEDFGGQATASAYYVGIEVVQLTGRPSTISGNFVGCAESSASVGGYQYYNLVSAFGSTDSHMIFTGNMAHGPASPTNKGIGYVMQSNGGGSTSIIYASNNDIDGINTVSFNDGSATLLQGVDTLSSQTLSGKTVAATANKVAGGLASLTSEVSISNSTTETTVLTTTLPTGDLVVGSTYRVRVHCTVLNLLTSNNLVIKVYLGGVAASAAFTWAGVITGGAVWNEFLVTVRSVGGSGTFMCNGVGMGTATGSTATTAANTVDTTQANPILKVTAQFSAASASNNAKFENAIIERVL